MVVRQAYSQRDLDESDFRDAALRLCLLSWTLLLLLLARSPVRVTQHLTASRARLPTRDDRVDALTALSRTEARTRRRQALVMPLLLLLPRS